MEKFEDQNPKVVYTTAASDKEKKTAMILCAVGILGIGGLHDFYVGKIGSGIIKFITCNWFVIGTIIDLLTIANGTYKDGNGQPLKR